MKRHPLLAFFALTYAITWGIAVCVIVFAAPLIARFGEMNIEAPFWKVVYHLAVYGPAIAAFVMVALRHGGEGVRSYAARLLQWNIGWRWYAIIFLGFPALQFISGWLANVWRPEQAVPLFAAQPWYTVVPMFLFSLINGPGPMEEIGWRGYALPLLQRRFNALQASLLLGLIWGLWHYPAFQLSGMPQGGMPFSAFVIGDMVAAVLYTVVYNGTGGSIPAVFLVHAIGNFNYGVDVAMTPAGLWTSLFLNILVVFALACWLGPQALGREKWTRVLPNEPASPDNTDRVSSPAEAGA